jgi:hypothetical protein
MAAEIARDNAGIVRAAAFRSAALIFEKATSIGLKSWE